MFYTYQLLYDAILSAQKTLAAQLAGVYLTPANIFFPYSSTTPPGQSHIITQIISNNTAETITANHKNYYEKYSCRFLADTTTRPTPKIISSNAAETTTANTKNYPANISDTSWPRQPQTITANHKKYSRRFLADTTTRPTPKNIP